MTKTKSTKASKATKATKPTSTKSTKSKKATKTATKKVAAPVAAVAAVPAVPAVPEVAAVAAVPTLTDSFAELLGHLQSLRSNLTKVTGQVRALQKRADRELKNAQKLSKKKGKRTGNRAPSGFVMPAKISDELANFLGKDQGSEMARTEVTREINAYIRRHNLQDSKNGRIINADASLTKLLKLTVQDELTYFNLQRYMSPHFAKAVKKEAVAPA